MKLRRCIEGEYVADDEFTDEEAKVVFSWESSTNEQKYAICEKYGWGTNGGIYVSHVPERPPVIFRFYVRTRLADEERTVEWRPVLAHDIEEAIKVAEKMPDVEVCLEASIIPGGVVT